MKIAYVYDCIYPYTKGGAEKRVWEIAKRFAEAGHEVHLYGIKWWTGNDLLIREGVNIHGVCPSPSRLYVNGRRSIGISLYFAFKVIFPLMKEDFDVIDCQQSPYLHCFSTYIYSKIKDIPLAITWYEVWGEYWFDYLGKLGIIGCVIERAAVAMPIIIIPISEKIKKDLGMMGVSRDILKVVPNGVDFKKIKNLDNNDIKIFDILYVGRLISHKNVDVLLRSIYLMKKKCPEIKCCIIGDGPERENLLKLCRDLGLERNVVFRGFIERDEDVYHHMHLSKLFILPSIREGFPNTILEANSCGLPVIIIRHEKNAAVGIIREGYNGFVLNLSPHEIAAKAISLLQNSDLLISLKKDSQNYAKNFDWSIIVENLEKVYKDVIEWHRTK